MYGVHSNYFKTTAALGILLTEEDVRERVNLRRQNLDDCPVTESDRKASLLHFTSDHAYTFKKSAVLAKRIKPSRFIHPRVEYINSMSKKYLAVDEDDETALRLLAKCEWDLRKHAEKSISSKKVPEVKIHNLKSIYEMKENSKKWKSEFSLPQFFLLQKKSLFQKTLSEDRNTLKGTTTDKGVNESLLISQEIVGPVQKASRFKEQRFNGRGALPQGTTHLMNTNLYEATPMQCLLNLVDKYWNGSKSLHYNENFLAEAEMILSAVQKSLPAGQQKHSTENQEVNKLLLEKEALQECLSQQEKQHSIRIKNLKSELSKIKKDMDVLKQYLNKLLKEKEVLKVHKFEVEENIQILDTADTASLQITDFENHQQLLIDENASMKKHLQNFNKMREMTVMLQESHRTLISTNEHLLKQLNEMHLKHKAEVEQLHCNYNQLKKTMDTLSPKL
ncbi:centrosomal protein of 72 kDa isoform X4 [Pantherophis guttatus]|uniref:Centrosomal protein of 72 kDa isoform X4 n=1 Tax=Pantherophis guttatus TaxID=94885 RepID=A0A6P9BQK8_PANGU|nr:centrosomal protein of 72 kDa isoform X4 [Pantherophis guttatus]